jgi:glutamyl-tRNA synthetase
MLNFLALMGWSPGGDREVMTRDEMVTLFTTEGLLAKASIFDTKKLEWMNGQHMVQMPLETLVSRVVPMLAAEGLGSAQELLATPDFTARLVDLLRPRARTIDELVRQARPYFGTTVPIDAAAAGKQWKDPAAARTLLQAARAALLALPAWDVVNAEAALRAVAEASGVGAGKLMQPLRVALTGTDVSPGIGDVLVLLGKPRSLERIDAALAHPRLNA